MLKDLFRSLRQRDFRIYYFGQLVSVTGTWMQNVAQSWLVYRLTDSSLTLGLVAFAGLAPVLVLGLPAGLLADRLPRRGLLIAAQTVALLQSLALAALVFTGHVDTWHIILLAVVLGVVHAVEMPSRHAFLSELVARRDLPNAIALNSSVFNLARFIGPAIAGWLVATFDEGWVFLINAATFMVVLLGLLSIRTPRRESPAGGERATRGLAEGLRYARGQTQVRNALLLLASTSLVGTAYGVLMPVFARDVFGGNAQTYGTLLWAAGGGALVAAFRLAYLGGSQALEKNIAVAAIVAGTAMLAFAATRQIGVALPILSVLGFCLTTLVASINTLLQLHTPDNLRGRVMALFSVLFIGLNSLGNLLAGSAAKVLGAPETVTLFGTVCLVVAMTYGLQMYRNKTEESGDGGPGGNAGEKEE